MTPEKQKIEIAEACGWVREYAAVPTWNAKLNNYKGDYEQVRTTLFRRAGKCVRVDSLPDYLNDLNAMHSAEETLDARQCAEYARQIMKHHPTYCVTVLDTSFDPTEEIAYETYQLVTATAAQRAEAFLRTIGKWEEST